MSVEPEKHVAPAFELDASAEKALDATVIVCTYNRADSLSGTLDCLSRQAVRSTLRWEVVVVDNNSSDHTRRIVEERRRMWPALRYRFEPNQGLSHARNHGIAAARGEILLFTDDDVCPEPDWVQRIADAMGRHGCDACGGYIAPVWEAAPPPWLTERFHGFLAIRADRQDTFEVTADCTPPFGANMAFRRNVFDRFGLFDVSRGRKGAVLAGGEDIELFDRILRNRGKVMFLGDARVHHRVEAFRLSKRYFRKWRFQGSRNLGATLGAPGDRRIAGIPLYFFPQLARAIGRAIRARLLEPRDEAFFRELLVWHFLGMMRGLVDANSETSATRATSGARPIDGDRRNDRV
jgi:glycosyltransferase involved in cell wall biosynthesis